MWDRDTLWSLLQHHDEEIQDWAVARLLALYPEATADLGELLPRVSASMASMIVMHTQGETFPPCLQAAWHTSTNPYLRARVAALLLRAGHTLTADQLASMEQGNVLDLLQRLSGISTTQQPVMLATRQSLVLAPEWRCSQAHFVAADHAHKR